MLPPILKPENIIEVCSRECNSNYTKYIAEIDKIVFCKCEKAIQTAFDSLVKFSNLPEKYKNISEKDLHELDSDTSLAIALDHIENLITSFKNNESPRGLYLYSGTGTGKTFLSCYTALEIIRQTQKSVYYSKFSRDFLQKIKSSWNDKMLESEEQIMNRHKKVDLLIIDEFGIGKTDSEKVGELIYDLIDYRYEQNKTTIFTSNLSRDYFSNLSEGRITSRLHGMSTEIFLDRKDFRRAIWHKKKNWNF